MNHLLIDSYLENIGNTIFVLASLMLCCLELENERVK